MGAVSDSDLLAIQLFIASLAAGFLWLAITQAGWTHRLFVISMFALSTLLAVVAGFWRNIAPLVPPIDNFFSSVATSRITWFALGALFSIVVWSSIRSISLRSRKPDFILEKDPLSDRYGIQTFLTVTYVQISVKTKQALTKCTAWISLVEYRENDNIPFALESNERHQCKWSRPNEFEVDLRPDQPPPRINIAIYTKDHGLLLEGFDRTPNNLYPLLNRVGVHKFTIVFTGNDKKSVISTKRSLYVDWRGPNEGAFLRLE